MRNLKSLKKSFVTVRGRLVREIACRNRMLFWFTAKTSPKTKTTYGSDRVFFFFIENQVEDFDGNKT